MNGYGGNDDIYGGGGNDTIDGGQGHDLIVGGTGMDRMTGGAGSDTFKFAIGDSGPTYGGADVINDFNRAQDWIDFANAGSGTSSNYTERFFFGDGTFSGTYAIALSMAQQDIGRTGIDYAFYTDSRNGYLFADLNGDNIVDTGIELRGLDLATSTRTISTKRPRKSRLGLTAGTGFRFARQLVAMVRTTAPCKTYRRCVRFHDCPGSELAIVVASCLHCACLAALGLPFADCLCASASAIRTRAKAVAQTPKTIFFIGISSQL